MARRGGAVRVSITAENKGLERTVAGSEKIIHRLGATSEHSSRRTAAANKVAGNSFTRLAKQAAGVAVAYVGIAKARAAVTTTEDLAKAAQGLHRNLGLTVQEASRWGAVAKARGIDNKSLTMSFTTLSKATQAGLGGDKKRLELFKSLGVTQKDLADGTQDFSGLVTKLADGFGRLKGGTERQAAAQQLLGRGYQSVLPLFAEGSKSLEEQLKWADKYGVTLTSKTIGPINELVKSQRELKVGQLGLSVGFTKLVAPGLLEVEHAGLRVLRVMNDPNLTGEQKWKRIGNIVGPIASKIGDGVTAAIPKIAEGVGENAPKVAEAFVKGFSSSNAWGKLAIGAFLLKKFGGFGAFAALGRRSGAAYGAGLAEGAAAGGAGGAAAGAAGGAAGGVIGRGGRRALSGLAGASFVTRAGVVVGGTAALNLGGARVGSAIIDAAKQRGGAGRVGLATGAAALLPGGPIAIARSAGALGTITGDAQKLNNWIIRTRASAADLNKELASGAHGFGSRATFSKEQIAAFTSTSQAVRTLASNFGFLRNRSATDLKTLRGVVAQNMAAIAVEMKTNPAQGQRDLTRSFRLAVRNVRALMDDGTISTKKGMREIARLMKTYAAQGSAGAEAGLASLVPAVKKAMTKSDAAAQRGMKILRDAFAQTARSYGLSPGAAIELANAQTAQATGVGGHGNEGITPKKAVGGIANPGSGSRDDHVLFDPRGRPVAALSGTEGIVNTPQMGVIDHALGVARAVGASRWGSLSQLWRSGMTHHARGGRVGRQVLTGADSPLRRIDQRALDVARRGANSQLGKIDAAQAAADVLGGFTGPTPAGFGTFDGFTVANWIIPELRYARAHGWKGHITSGYRSHAHNVAQGRTYFSEHERSDYPHGAVDFGGFVDPAGLANREAFLRATRGYRGPHLIRPQGFRDDGHLSGTGHRGGGILGRFARGGRLSPGQMASLAYTVGKVRPKSAAIRMGAIGMRESHGDPGAHNYDPPRDDSWGLWQINVLPNANPRFKSWNLRDPNVNARAMGILHRASGERPWGGYPESSFSGWIDNARRGFSRSGGRSGGGSGGGTKFAGKGPGIFGRGGSEGPVRNVGPTVPLMAQMTPTFFGTRMSQGNMVDAEGNVTYPDRPTAIDYLNSAAAQAALTPDTADDIVAANAAVAYGTTAYQQAITGGDPRKITEAATNLKGWQDALKGLTDAVDNNTEAQLASAQAMADLQKQRADDAQTALRVSQTQYGVLKAALADIISGEIGGRIGLGAQSPSAAGVLARY